MFLIPSVLGGLLRALLLSWSGDRNFVVLVPWLVLVATLLILARPLLVPQSSNSEDHPQLHLSPVLWAVAVILAFLVALYGGHFGAGIGILLISALSLMRIGNIRHVVSLKNLLAGCLRGVEVAVLVFEDLVDWRSVCRWRSVVWWAVTSGAWCRIERTAPLYAGSSSESALE